MISSRSKIRRAEGEGVRVGAGRSPATKKGKMQPWGHPASSPSFPNVRQSLGFPIRRNVARCRAVSYRLCLTRPMSNLDGLRPVRSSAFKFFRAVERCNAPAGLNHVQQRSDRFADVSHAHRLSSALSLDAHQRIEKDSHGAEQISQGRGKHE